jgi:hypothetical protein
MVTKIYIFPQAKAIVDKGKTYIGGFNLSMKGFDKQINRLAVDISVPLHQQLQKQECLTI